MPSFITADTDITSTHIHEGAKTAPSTVSHEHGMPQCHRRAREILKSGYKEHMRAGEVHAYSVRCGFSLLEAEDAS